LDDLKNVGESNYNPEDGTDQRVQSLVFMMMMMMNFRSFSVAVFVILTLGLNNVFIHDL